MGQTSDLLLCMEHLVEGINDPYIFKAIFLAGGPGSGKSFIGEHMFKGLGVKFVNSDDTLTFLTGQAANWDEKEMDRLLDMRVLEPVQQARRERAKVLSKHQKAGWINGMLGMVIDGTARDTSQVSKAKKAIEELGYDTSMVFVNTSLEVAWQRNLGRRRKVNRNVVEDAWNSVQKAMRKYKSMFGSGNFMEVINDRRLDGPAEDALGMMLRSRAMSQLAKPLENPVGRKVVEYLQKTGGKTLSDLP